MRKTGIRRAAIATAIALTLTSVLAAPAAATDGWLDPTFSGDGWVRLPQGAGAAGDLVVVPGPSGGAIVARLGNRGGSPIIETLALTPSGGLSSSFNDGTWGSLVIGEHDTLMTGFAATPSGGAVGALGPYQEIVLRIREIGPDGAIIGGVAVAQSAELLSANVVRLPGGSIRTCTSEGTPDEHRLIGFTPTYVLDPAIGEDGQRALPIDDCFALGADAAGHLYVAGKASIAPDEPARVDLLRTTTSGVVDTAWNGDGLASIGLPGIDVHLARGIQIGIKQFSPAVSPILPLSDGSVYIVARVTRQGTHLRSAAIIKLTPDGELDPSFDGDGVRAFAPPDGQSRILAMAVDADGRPVISFIKSFRDGNSRGFLARLTTSGAFDPTFGRGGEIQQSLTADSLLIDAQGRIVTVARQGSGPQDAIVVARRNG